MDTKKKKKKKTFTFLLFYNEHKFIFVYIFSSWKDVTINQLIENFFSNFFLNNSDTGSSLAEGDGHLSIATEHAIGIALHLEI
jgi:hypothetical protein